MYKGAKLFVHEIVVNLAHFIFMNNTSHLNIFIFEEFHRTLVVHIAGSKYVGEIVQSFSSPILELKIFFHNFYFISSHEKKGGYFFTPV